MKRLGTAVMLLAGLTALAAVARPRPASAAAGAACRAWQVRTLLSGQGWLESLAFDGRGGMTISALTADRVLRLKRGGRLRTLVASVNAPGGQAVVGGDLYFTTGDTVPPAANGTIDRLDLRTGRLTVWARGLTMPNGLAFLPGGDAVVTRDLETGPPPTDVTRIPARPPRRARVRWARVPDGNGLVVDPSGRWLYVDRTFSSDGRLVRVNMAHPSTIHVIGRLGAGAAPDDMTIDRRGVLWIAGFGAGKIFRLDPRTHTACAVASGLVTPTAVVFGGQGWPSGHLFVTSAGGFLYELTPPRP